MLVSVGAQIAALTPCVRPRTRTLLLVASGVLSVIPWFGKPTYALFTFAQLLAFAFAETDTPDARRQRRRWIATFVVGGAVGALTQVIFLLIYADLGAFVRIYFIDVPRFYRFIWPRTFIDSLNPAGSSTMSALALVSSLAMLGLIVDGQLPRRALAVALVPLAGLASVVIQAKGFPYHFHPVSAGLYLQGLVLVVGLSEQLGRPAEGAPTDLARLLRLVPFGAASVLGLAVVAALLSSPHLENWWILQKGVTAGLRQSKDYFVYFRTADFFPWEMRQTAAYLRAHTRPEDTVQVYGMDPYLLFLADRRSATPYIYAYDLDADAALTGSSLPEGLHPTWDRPSNPRHARRERARFPRAHPDRPSRRVRLHGPLTAHQRGRRRLARLRRAQREERAVGARALQADGGVRR